MRDRNKILQVAAENLLKKQELEKAIGLFEKLHPADAAEIIGDLPDDFQKMIFETWDIPRAADTFQEMDEQEQMDIVELLSTPLISDILEEMEADDVADLLGAIDKKDAQRILAAMDREDAQEALRLMEHGEDTAGGIMTPEFVALRKDMTAQESIDLLRAKAPGAETIYYVFIVNRDDQLVGVISLRDLIIGQPSRLVEELMNPNVIYVDVDTDQEEVARIMSRYDLLALPVVDREHRLLGVVTIDDVIDVIEEEATEDIYKFSGTLGGEEDISGTSLLRALKVRLPWLLFALLGEAVVVGSISGQFDYVVTELLPTLLVFWTAMTAIGGNMAVQTSTIVIRSLAMGEFDKRALSHRVLREARLGIVVGLISAVSFFLLGLLWKGKVELGMIAALSSIMIVVVAAMLGAFAPLVFKRLGYDPAAASGPFLTLTMDATSISIYMLIALLILR
ncbi:MAG: magnesium transporter [Actinomycetota bacterium]|nr:magnesium transporter [Actinomycetota bacterium]